jgi:hypothetical protein
MKGKKTGGRTKGTLNKATREAKEFCASVIDDPAYQARLRSRAVTGKLSPAVECMLWYYAKGKPIERREITQLEDVSQMTDAELKADLLDLAMKL